MSEDGEKVAIELDAETLARLDAVVALAKGTLTREWALSLVVARGLPLLEAQAHNYASRNLSRCPRCSCERLETVDLENVRMRTCPDCGGQWLDLASTHQLLRSLDPLAAETAERLAAEATVDPDLTRRLMCPICGEPLERQELVHADARVHLCRNHGCWFDRRELPQLLQAQARQRADTARVEAALRDMGLASDLAQLESRLEGKPSRP